MGTRHLTALLLLGELACEASPRVCPPGTIVDDGRARAVVAAARGTRAGHHLAFEGARLCFGGPTRGTVHTDGVVVLADHLDDGAAAARLTHLWMHVADGLHHFPAAEVPCDRQVQAALVAESRGIVAEIETCAELGCETAPYSFAATVLASAPTQRPDRVLTRLRAQPDADGLGELVRDYQRRCAHRE